MSRRPLALHRLPSWLLPSVLLGVAFSIYLIVHAHQVNHGIDGFPLDDPWIHLTYARNLHSHHSFSYFPGEKATAGSTAPLYTLLLALGFAFTRDEKLLSYVLGIIFHAAFLAVAALWARKQLGHVVWASALVLLLAFDPRIAILSVSGMETSLFLLLIALAFWAHAGKRWTMLGVALGLGVWVRPDMLILAGVFAIAALLERFGRAATAPRRTPKRVPEKAVPPDRVAPSTAWMIPFGVLLLLYFAFNLATGGRPVPNTFAAKQAYYTASMLYFLTHGVRECFLAHGFRVLTPLALGTIAAELVRLLRRRPGPYRAEAGWSIALPLAYILLLPFAHRFSRYLVPALPAVALLGLAAIRDGLRWIAQAKRPLAWASPAGVGGTLVLLVVFAMQAAGTPHADREYHEYCLYHYQRQERCGRWLRESTPPTAVIATHDVGAIAYYSDRKIVDVVGLIQPDAAPHLHKPDYIEFLNHFFERQKVTHLAFLDNWMEVANQEPLWLADEHPELLKVYAWNPGRTLLVPERVTGLNQRALRLAKGGDVAKTIQILQRSLQLCPNDSRTWLLMGGALELSGDAAGAERAYRTALEWFPDYEDARFSLGSLLANEGRGGEALATLDPLYERRPSYPGLAQLHDALRANQRGSIP